MERARGGPQDLHSGPGSRTQENAESGEERGESGGWSADWVQHPEEAPYPRRHGGRR